MFGLRETTRRGARRVAVTATALLLGAGAAEAKILYVDGANGNDSTTYAANGPSSPWRTIGRAAWGSTNRDAPNANEAARAGDIVRIAAGTYTTTATNYRFGPAYNPVNNGTASSPIRFEGMGTVNLVFSSGTGPMIGAENRNYIQWSGFSINETTAPSRSDTGPVVFVTATGGSIENCYLTGNPNWTSRVGDNYDAIRIHGASGIRVFNNRIVDFGGQTGDENHNGVETYFAADLVIEHNEFHHNGAGIYMKGNNLQAPTVGRFTIRYNKFTRNHNGIRVLLIPSTESQPNLISQNIFENNRMGLTIQVFDRGLADPRHVKAINNTFVGNQWALFVGGSGGLVDNSGHVFWNNVVVGGSFALMVTHPGSSLAKSNFDAEHNLYHGYGTHSEVSGNNYSLATWKSSFQQDQATPAAVQGDPLFVNASTGDYRLQSGSPAAGLGRVRYGVGGSNGSTVPAGAYITGSETIGLTSGSTTPPPPTPLPAPVSPTNVRIIR